MRAMSLTVLLAALTISVILATLAIVLWIVVVPIVEESAGAAFSGLGQVLTRDAELRDLHADDEIDAWVSSSELVWLVGQLEESTLAGSRIRVSGVISASTWVGTLGCVSLEGGVDGWFVLFEEPCPRLEVGEDVTVEGVLCLRQGIRLFVCRVP